jgi:low temperature requirement protein LtrA
MTSHDRSAVVTPRRPLRLRMQGRDPAEAHRASTPLELLFDLCFVVAVAQVAAALHHELAVGHAVTGLATYLIAFFGIWWPWVNFTWFASAYDTDDVPYRLLTFVQIAGVLVIAAGVPRIFAGFDFSIAVTGYVIMRLGLVVQWLRAAREDRDARPVALRFALGITLVQSLWIARLAIGGPVGFSLILVFGVVELLIPVWAERSGRGTPWHPDHIAERYGLFTIIVLGECVLAATTAVQQALGISGASTELTAIAVGGLLLVFALWWTYFKVPARIGHYRSLSWMIGWGYGHYVIFAAVAALGAGLAFAIDAVTGVEHVPAIAGSLAVAVPVAVALFAIGFLHRREGYAWGAAASLGARVILVLGLGASAGLVGTALAVLGTGVAVVAIVARGVLDLQRRSADGVESLEALDVVEVVEAPG